MAAEKKQPSEIRLVQPYAVRPIWDRVSELLKPAVDMNPGFNLQDVLSSLEISTSMLWVAIDDRGIHAAMVTQLLNYPQCKTVMCLFMGGNLMGRMPEFYPPLKAYAKAVGADYVEGIGRPGFKRIMKDKIVSRQDHLILSID
jgi:hypothetical protein